MLRQDLREETSRIHRRNYQQMIAHEPDPTQLDRIQAQVRLDPRLTQRDRLLLLKAAHRAFGGGAKGAGRPMELEVGTR